ncbi:putative porin [Adhaeribacter arboris]|uniref:putative porin n=1 Tax=Adhaeribacter arboris TaxID=2072846 RepID=UPI00130492AA|nr:putative porin [Adhaeribacter arboris]
MKYILTVLTSFLFAFSVLSPAQAQILNDSTVNLYSPKTTKVIRETEIFRGNYDLSTVDTTLNNLQQLRNWYHDTTFYQDLGNLATPSKRLLFTLPDQIGARYGRSIFDRYNLNPTNQVYFDTKSPYSRLNYVQGGNGQQIFDGTFSRNINENANVGFTYERISSEKFYGSSQIRGSREVERTGITLFTHLQTKENKYHLFASVRYTEQAMLESGGIRRSSQNNDNLDSLYSTSDVQVYLNTASNREYRKNVHLSQVYRIAKEHLKVYHTLDYFSQFNRFKDNALAYLNDTTGKRAATYFYPNTYYDSVRTSDAADFRYFENSFGIMSDSKLHYFKGYIKQRSVNYRNTLLNVEQFLPLRANDSVNEEYKNDLKQYFLGGHGEFKFRDIFNITTSGEYQLFKDYRLEAALRLKFLTVAQSRMSYSPTYTQQRILSNHFDWKNDFRNTVADRTSVRVEGSLFHNTLNLEFARTNIQNYVYFDTKALPAQTGQQLQLYTLSLHHHLALNIFHMDNTFNYTDNSKAEIIRVPKWMVNSKVYFEGHLFKKVLYGQVGAEMFLQDKYYADAYMPANQQFYLQNDFRIPSYPIVDAFITADIKSLNIFVKMAHVNQGIPQDGYFTTPIYLGQPRNLTFGIRWMFFD